jgi:hypothetical protein
MSVYFVAQWSVPEADRDACEGILADLAAHIEAAHPTVRSIRTMRQWWGQFPRRTYIWYEEFDDLGALQAADDPAVCARLWADLSRLADAGTMHGSVWEDPQRGSWFER